MSAAPILVVTELHPPAVPAQAVARERLFAQLREGAAGKLTLVACPAGFGKSTLLGAWEDERPVAWVSLDEGDDDAVVLWSHVIAALGVDVALNAPLREVVLPRLVNALAELPPRRLVLDDFHRLSRTDELAWFIEHAPASVQIVIATRTDPELPLASLRARGQLVELRDLRFTTAEAAEFLNARLQLGLDDRDIDTLVARTEGWPAGIYLAALSLAHAPDKHALVAAFDGTSAHIVDFLAAEVLAAHPPELQEFMLRTSVLERLSAPLCETLYPGAGLALDVLARTNLFLIALDDRREWFRFHHLFAQLLRARLDADTANELHRRAFAWHREHGTVDEAIQHALAAGARDEAAALIEEHWVEYANSGRTASVLGWLEQLPGRLERVRAWVMALVGREAEMRAAAARVALVPGPTPDGFASAESSLAVLQATFGWGDVGAIIAHGERSAELEGPDSPWRAVITWALGWAHYVNGDLDAAERWLRETTVIAPPAGQWIVGVAAIADLSLIAGMRGRRAEQLELAEEALRTAREVGLLDAIEDGEVHTAYGVALGDREALEKGVFLRRLWAQPLDLIDGLIALATPAAFEEAEALIATCRDPGALPQRLAAARGRGAPLSDRERTILRMLGGGLTEREIGRELYLSFNTVHTHVKAIYRKLGVSSRAEARERAKQLT